MLTQQARRLHLDDPYKQCMRWVGSTAYNGTETHCCFGHSLWCPKWEERCQSMVAGKVHYAQCMSWVGSKFYSNGDVVPIGHANFLVFGLLAVIVLLGVLALLRFAILTCQQMRAQRRRIAAATKHEVALAAAVSEIPLSAYEGANADGHECIICLSPFASGQSIRLLPCGHSFHTACVDAWLLRRGDAHDACIHAVPRCPLCKATPFTEEQLETAGLSVLIREDVGEAASLEGTGESMIAGGASTSSSTASSASSTCAAVHTSSSSRAVGQPGSLVV